MNKKKKNTRVKHRKNKARIRNLIQVSLSKAKPKKIIQATKVTQNEKNDDQNLQKNAVTKKTTAKKTVSKKTTAKKSTTKKTTAKKSTTKKTVDK